MIFVITSRKGILKMDKKNILITGASSGIGAACALLAAERGCNLAIHYHLNSDGIKLVKKKCTEIGISVQVLQGDLSDHNDINRIFSILDNCSFRIDALINNAGITLDNNNSLAASGGEWNRDGIQKQSAYKIKFLTKNSTQVMFDDDACKYRAAGTRK